MVVLPSFTCIGKLVPVAAISVALADPGSLNDRPAALPEHLGGNRRGISPVAGRRWQTAYCFIIDTCFQRRGSQ